MLFSQQTTLLNNYSSAKYWRQNDDSLLYLTFFYKNNQVYLRSIISVVIGYYRVNYDKRNWKFISTYLLGNNYTRIPALNRAQVISDAYYFTINNKLKSSSFLNITNYLRKETDFIPWYPMFNILSYIDFYRTPTGETYESE